MKERFFLKEEKGSEYISYSIYDSWRKGRSQMPDFCIEELNKLIPKKDGFIILEHPHLHISHCYHTYVSIDFEIDEKEKEYILAVFDKAIKHLNKINKEDEKVLIKVGYVFTMYLYDNVFNKFTEENILAKDEMGKHELRYVFNNIYRGKKEFKLDCRYFDVRKFNLENPQESYEKLIRDGIELYLCGIKKDVSLDKHLKLINKLITKEKEEEYNQKLKEKAKMPFTNQIDYLAKFLDDIEKNSSEYEINKFNNILKRITKYRQNSQYDGIAEKVRLLQFYFAMEIPAEKLIDFDLSVTALIEKANTFQKLYELDEKISLNGDIKNFETILIEKANEIGIDKEIVNDYLDNQINDYFKNQMKESQRPQQKVIAETSAVKIKR